MSMKPHHPLIPTTLHRRHQQYRHIGPGAQRVGNWREESALASIESMEEAEGKFKDMEYDFTWFDNPTRLIHRS
eukprot:11716666-Prorocentrum_lima.AAC.1